MDPKYGGVAVSRAALQDDEQNDPLAPVADSDEEDPFAAPDRDISDSGEGPDTLGDLEQGSEVDEDEELDSDEALGESDAERFKDFKFLGSRRSRLERETEGGDSGEESEEVESGQSEDDSTDDTDVSMADENDYDEEDDQSDDGGSSISSAASQSAPSRKPARNADREELRKVAFSSQSTAGLASALSAGANADVAKGQAVKRQRQTFDRLLDARIKFQKGVTAMNQLPNSTFLDADVKKAAQQAEDAALGLWSTIDSIRCAILSAQTEIPSSKEQSQTATRKRPFAATRATSSSELCHQSTTLESGVQPIRRSTLDKWHAKTQPILDAAPRSKLLKPTQSSRTRLTDVLDTYLATESSKLTSLSTTPSSATGTGLGTFDDDHFYQALLRDLIASRNASLSHSLPSTSQPFLPTKLHVSGSKAKKVDTRASKGRKVRYTVHEKLEHFMAAEDRATWEDAARSEFFASLLGNSGALDEGVLNGEEGSDGEGNVHDAGDEVDGEVEALRLFRN